MRFTGISTNTWPLAGARLDGLYVCPHHPDEGCPCRKPKPELLLRAARDLDLDLTHSYLVGDRYQDLETAANAGVKGILVLTGYGRGEYESLTGSGRRSQPVYVAQDLADAAAWILEDLTERLMQEREGAVREPPLQTFSGG